MEEKQLFEEIKPLIEEYKKFVKQKNPEVFNWNDSRASSIGKTQEINYTKDREGEILEILDEEKNIKNRRELIEELVKIREAKKQEMRKAIFEKVGSFISDSKEKMNQEIEEKRQELEKQKEEKRIHQREKEQELKEKREKRNYMNRRSIALQGILLKIGKNTELGMEDKVYISVGDEVIQANREKENLARDINTLESECKILKSEYDNFFIEKDEGLQELVKRLNEFDDIYGNISFESEEAINYIETIAENYKEKNGIPKLEADDVEVIEPPKVYKMDDFQEDRVMKEFERIEAGNEDLLNQSYLKFKNDIIRNYTSYSYEEVLKVLEGKTLLDIYEEQLANMDNSLSREEIEKAIEELKIRNANTTSVTNEEIIRSMENRKALQEKLMKRFAEIEVGNEDLIHPKYSKFKENLLEREDIEEVIKVLEGKTLLNIYKEQANHMKVNSETRNELEKLIEELETRRAKPQETKSQETKPQEAKSQETKTQEAKPQEAKTQETKTQEQQYEKVLNEIEQEFMRFETGNEDLLLPIYYDYKQQYIKDSTEDINYANRILEYTKQITLLDFYEDILVVISRDVQPSEKDIIADVKDIMTKLKERDKCRIKSTTIVLEPYKDLIEINIKGREKTIVLSNILALIDKGKELQERELISKFGVNRCNPVILAALTAIGEKYPIHKDLIDEYINTFSEAKTDKIDDIIYYFNKKENNKADNYKKIVNVCKRYAKADQKYGMATIEKSDKEGIWDKFKGLGNQIQTFFSNQKQKRLESKEAKEYRTSRLKRFKEKNEDIETPVKKRNPREAFMKKINEKGKKQDGEMDMSEAIKKLESIGQSGNEPIFKDEEEVL